jgi:hypothetical protein
MSRLRAPPGAGGLPSPGRGTPWQHDLTPGALTDNRTGLDFQPVESRILSIQSRVVPGAGHGAPEERSGAAGQVRWTRLARAVQRAEPGGQVASLGAPDESSRPGPPQWRSGLSRVVQKRIGWARRGGTGGQGRPAEAAGPFRPFRPPNC